MQIDWQSKGHPQIKTNKKKLRHYYQHEASCSLIMLCADLLPGPWQFCGKAKAELDPLCRYCRICIITNIKKIWFPEHLSHSPSKTLVFACPSNVFPHNLDWGLPIVSGEANYLGPEKEPLVWGRTRDAVSHLRGRQGWQLRDLILTKTSPLVNFCYVFHSGHWGRVGEWWMGVG